MTHSLNVQTEHGIRLQKKITKGGMVHILYVSDKHDMIGP